MQRNLFTYIWRHSRPEQIVILGLVVLAQVFYFMSLTVPKPRAEVLRAKAFR